MKKSLKRQSNKIDLSHMRHPKPLAQRSVSSSVSLSARKSKSNFSPLPKSKSKQNDKYSEILNKVLGITISNKTNHVLLRKHLTQAIEPHILILNEAIKGRDEIGKNLLKNGKFLKKCCEILQQNPYYKLGSLLQYIRKTYISNIVQHKSEFQKYYESKLETYNQSQQEPIVIKYDLNGNQIQNTLIINQSNKKEDNTQLQLSDEQSAIVIKYDLNGNQIKNQISPSFQPQQIIPNIPTQHLFIKQTPQIFQHTQQFPNIKKLFTNLQMIPKKGILKPSKYKLNQTPEKQIQTNLNQMLYPGFDDYNMLLNQKQNSSKDNLPQKERKNQNTIIHQTSQLTHIDKIKNVMTKVFKINTIYNIQDLNIVGIIETDYEQMGQYGVLLVSDKKDKDKRQILVVFPLKTEVNEQALQKVKSRFASILGWVINDTNIDLNEYWAENLDSILPS